MRISDWSSDVCSSDLPDLFLPRMIARNREGHQLIEGHAVFGIDVVQLRRHVGELEPLLHDCRCDHEGRRDGFDVAALFHELLHGAKLVERVQRDRTSDEKGRSVSVRVELGGSRLNKKKKTTK